MVSGTFNDPEQLSQKIRRINHADVDGNLFIEVLLKALRLRNAEALARALPIAAAVLSRVRRGGKVSDDMLLKLHLTYGLSISGLKDLICACTRSDRPITAERITALTGCDVFIQQQQSDQ